MIVKYKYHYYTKNYRVAFRRRETPGRMDRNQPFMSSTSFSMSASAFDSIFA